MTLYKARKDNINFFIQPGSIKSYAQEGYEIIKLEEMIIQDINKETENINTQTGSQYNTVSGKTVIVKTEG